MEISLLEKEKNQKMSFVISNTSSTFTNTIRRTIIEEVPTMCIEDVEIKKNNSFLYDEIIAHRLGLIPLTSDIRSYNLKSDCNCEGEGCGRCQIQFTLKAKGPALVYASDIQTKDPKIKPVYPKTIIVKLQKAQVLEIQGTAELGKGKDHVKWSPGHVFYRQKPVVEIIKDSEYKEAVVEACPQIFEIRNNKLEVIKENLYKCDVVEEGVKACKDGAITLSYVNDYIFTVESWGQLSCKKMVLESVKIISNHFNEFSEKIKELG